MVHLNAFEVENDATMTTKRRSFSPIGNFYLLMVYETFA